MKILPILSVRLSNLENLETHARMCPKSERDILRSIRLNDFGLRGAVGRAAMRKVEVIEPNWVANRTSFKGGKSDLI